MRGGDEASRIRPVASIPIASAHRARARDDDARARVNAMRSTVPSRAVAHRASRSTARDERCATARVRAMRANGREIRVASSGRDAWNARERDDGRARDVRVERGRDVGRDDERARTWRSMADADADARAGRAAADARMVDAREAAARADALAEAMSGVFSMACGVLRFGLPATGGVACWAAAAANAGEGLLGALGGALLVGTTLGVCAMIFATVSATLSGITLAWITVRRWFRGDVDARAARRVRSPRARRASDDDGGRGDGRSFEDDERRGNFRYDDWEPTVPIVDPRAPERLGTFQNRAAQNPNAWGTHKTPADFRRELRERSAYGDQSRRDDDEEGSFGSNQWRSRAAYRQAEGFNDPSLVSPAPEETTVFVDPHEEVLRKFAPKERLLPRTPPKPKHAYIPTEVLIAMGGASLESHIGNHGQDILSSARKSRPSNVTPSGSSTSASIVNGMFGFNDRARSNPATPEGEPKSRRSEAESEAGRSARERFERNLRPTFERPPSRDYESEFFESMRRVESARDDDDDDDDMERLRRAR